MASAGATALVLSGKLDARVTRSWRRNSSVRVCALANAVIPPQFGFVALTAASSAILTQWQAVQVGIQRRKVGLKYPKMYEDAENSLFNCYQRAHQNTLENYPAFLALLLTSGLGYPVTASICGMIWVLGRVVYSLGYYTGDPNNRLKGIWNAFGLLGLLVTAIVFGYNQLTAIQHFLDMDAKGGTLKEAGALRDDGSRQGVLDEGNKEKKKGSFSGGQEPANKAETEIGKGVVASAEEQADMRRSADFKAEQERNAKAIEESTGVKITKEEPEGATTSVTGLGTKNTFYQG